MWFGVLGLGVNRGLGTNCRVSVLKGVVSGPWVGAKGDLKFVVIVGVCLVRE